MVVSSVSEPVPNSKKQSATTGILNGLALGYLSNIIPVVGLDITFLIAYLCVARSVRHWEPWACLALATGSQVAENFHLRNLTYELPRQTLPMRRGVSHVTEFTSIGAQIDFEI